MKAKQYLQQIRKIDQIIKNKMIEQEQLRTLAESVTASIGGERVQSSGNQQRMESTICKLIDKEDEIKSLVKNREEIISVIEQLDLSDYDLLHKVYVQGKKLKEVDGAYTNLTTQHGRALAKVQKIIDKMCDSV